MKIFSILLLSFLAFGVYAQETIPASAGEATGSGGTSSYTVGQIVYKTDVGTNGSVSNGVQQPYEISIVSVNEVEFAVDLLVYPNPTNEFVKLILDTERSRSVKTIYQLYDLSGKLIESKIISSNETKINMQSLKASTYFLKVEQNEKELKTFKIVKN